MVLVVLVRRLADVVICGEQWSRDDLRSIRIAQCGWLLLGRQNIVRACHTFDPAASTTSMSVLDTHIARCDRQIFRYSAEWLAFLVHHR
jgi:hypothetical protein